jgi:hypothetical protein
MCQRLYLASRSPLPVRKRGAEADALTVSPLSAEAAAVRRWFSKDARHFAEARPGSPCGCGWPELGEQTATRLVSKDEEEPVRELAAHMEQLPGKRYIAELLLTWVWDEADSPSNRREISLEDMKRTGFRFRRGEILRVRAG